MGALPSRETHQRGLYSHRHGRNRRSEIILIPLTSTFFPSPDCDLFQHLYNARNRRTVKYYLRAPRSTDSTIESDYFCNTVRVNEPEEFNKFNQERFVSEKLPKKQPYQSSQTQASGLNLKPQAPNPLNTMANGGENQFSCSMTGGESHRKSTPQDYDYQSYSDTPEGLYHVLVHETDLCVYDTDFELRDAYYKQIQEQRMELDRVQKEWCRRPSMNASLHTATDPSHNIPSTNTPAYHLPQRQSPHPFMQGKAYSKDMDPSEFSTQLPKGNWAPGPSASIPPPVPDVSSNIENISFDAFVSGYIAAKRYMRGKKKNTNYRAVDNNFNNGIDDVGVDINHSTTRVDQDMPRQTSSSTAYSDPRKYVKHTTSPSAYYIHPIPCVIASRYVEKKPPVPDDPYCVMFEGFYVKIMGMFGLFPSTVPMRYEKVSGDSHETAMDDLATEASTAHQTRQHHHRAMPQKEDYPSHDDDIDNEVNIEQHLLKGSMFVDKDVGDQILGNMVMLAAHMYVRQCIEARIQPQCIPMLPFFMRFPLSNIPMLQFVREFRLRLRVLLEAGTAKSGYKPMHAGLGGISPEEVIEDYDPKQLRSEAEGYLFEENIPDVDGPRELFMGAQLHQEYMSAIKRPTSNTNPMGNFPIMMLSGFNVQHAALRHPALNVARLGRRSSLAKNHQWGSALLPTVDPQGLGYPSQPSTFPCLSPNQEAHKLDLLERRKKRFRLWVEKGYMCIWASAAYARRACILLAQQLNTTVDGTALPGMRSWRYRGLLHGGTHVPRPEMANDTLIVAEDIPSAGLWQGDVLRCCTNEELLAYQAHQPLPLPGAWRTALSSSPMATTRSAKGVPDSSDIGQSGNPALQEQVPAPTGAFWVRGSGGLDDSFIDVTEPNISLNPKMDKQIQQVAQQQARKRAAAAITVAKHHNCVPVKEEIAVATMMTLSPTDNTTVIDYREGTLKIEEVILSWMRSVYMQTRKIPEDEQGWLCDPSGHLVRLDRYTFHRFEHDGVRFFIGSTTRFVGQQQRIDKILDELNTMEKRELQILSTEGDKTVLSGTVEALAGPRSRDSLLWEKYRCSDPHKVDKTLLTWREAVGDSQTSLEIVDDDDEDMFHLVHIGYGNYLGSDD
ncbi:unnamed protein product [Phytomonas sp. Hart1]|nr:unnamed protein product [Phytomonas sp. Hart1]|eukprot:CCW69828.1 unnamed protein product [Phytomonas sp. isolate Hart1]